MTTQRTLRRGVDGQLVDAAQELAHVYLKGDPRRLNHSAGAARAAAYPERPITFICPWPAGGTADQTMRALCLAAGRQLGQTVVVENKAGAGGTLAAGHVMRAAPDGYTYLIHHNGMATAPALYRKLQFDPLTVDIADQFLLQELPHDL